MRKEYDFEKRVEAQLTLRQQEIDHIKARIAATDVNATPHLQELIDRLSAHHRATEQALERLYHADGQRYEQLKNNVDTHRQALNNTVREAISQLTRIFHHDRREGA